MPHGFINDGFDVPILNIYRMHTEQRVENRKLPRSIKITEQHYLPWVQAIQTQLEDANERV